MFKVSEVFDVCEVSGVVFFFEVVEVSEVSDVFAVSKSIRY